MRKKLILLIMLVIAITANAQDKPHKFNPEKFDAEQQQFITREAGLTEQEATRFFPLFREMQQKQRALYSSQRKLGHKKPADDAACEQAIRQRDKIDVELKQIQQTYHSKFLKLLPASKLYDVLKAEERFFRMKLRNWGDGQKPAKPHRSQ